MAGRLYRANINKEAGGYIVRNIGIMAKDYKIIAKQI